MTMLAIRSGKKWENPKSVSYDNPLKVTEMRSLGQRKQFLVRPKDDQLNNDGVVYSIPCECGKVLETGTPMQDRIKEHERDIRLVLIQTSTVSEHANNNGHNPLWNEVKFIDRDRHWYTGRVKAIQIRLHPNNINRASGIEISEAWMATITKQNNRTARIETHQSKLLKTNQSQRSILFKR